jgi:hypothetical protein
MFNSKNITISFFGHEQWIKHVTLHGFTLDTIWKEPHILGKKNEKGLRNTPIITQVAKVG